LYSPHLGEALVGVAGGARGAAQEAVEAPALLDELQRPLAPVLLLQAPRARPVCGGYKLNLKANFETRFS
jgi:hypothetical protein